MPIDRCGHECPRTEPFEGFCGCVRCANCYHWIKRCDTPHMCEWLDERDDWTDEDVEHDE